MRNKNGQMSLCDTYSEICEAVENDTPKFLLLLEIHINWSELIPIELHYAYYRSTGRPREYDLESMIRFFILQKILGIQQDNIFLNILKLCRELRDFCGFDSVPDASQITRFRQYFVGYIETMFNKMVELTEPICREIDVKKADYLIYDPTGIPAYVAENNPKFFNTKLNNAKKISRKNPEIKPHALAYSQMPDTAEANPFVNQQYIYGHFCYAHKAGILTNGLGIVRGIAFFDEDFKRRHPEVVTQKTDNPEHDKEIGDLVSLKPVLTDFFEAHPDFSYKTFFGDSAFDSYDNYKMLQDFGFKRMAIPINPRNSANSHKNFDLNGTPVCPADKTPFTFIGYSGGKNRSARFKWVCHKSVRICQTIS